MKSSIAMVIMATALAGCGDGPSSEDALLSHGYSQNYVAGYHDGCGSGRQAGGDFTARSAQDQAAYVSGSEYATGWDYGFVSCRDAELQNEQTAAMIGAVIASGIASDHGADGIDARKAIKQIDTSGLEAFN